MTAKPAVALAIITTILTATLPSAADDPATQPTTATAPAADPGLDAHWQEVLNRLGSAAFAERQAAQKSLDDATYRDIPRLKALAAATSDEEAKSRISIRIDAIEEEIAINPPPLTFDLKDKPLSDIALALAAATGTKIEAYNIRPNGVTFSLAVKDKPFWDVIAELSKQHPLSFESYAYFRLVQSDPGQQNFITSGSLAVFPINITRSKSVNLQQPPGNQVGNEQLNIQFNALLDPRVKVSRYRQPEFTEIIDDNGNTLFKKQPQPNQTFPNSMSGGSRMWVGYASLTIPPNLGKTIVSAKGELAYVINLAEDKIEIADINTKLNQPIPVLGDTVTIRQFELVGNSINFNISQQRAKPAPNANIVVGNNPENIPLGMTFIDATGKRIWTSYLYGGHSGGVGANDVKAPIRIEFTRPTKTKEVITPFELKNLPLP